MRPVLFALFAASATASAAKNGCVLDIIEDLAAKTSCGCSRAITKCLSTKVDLEQLDQIQHCYIAGGCDESDAAVGAAWFAKQCHEDGEAVVHADLMIRADKKTTTEAAKTTEPAAATSNAAAATTSPSAAQSSSQQAAATSTTPTSTVDPKTTTTEATTASSTSPPSSTTVPSTTSNSQTSTTSPTTTATTTGSSTTSIACFVTNMVTTSYCSVSHGSTFSCTPTITPSASCAPGVLCQTDLAGNPICMLKDNHLTTSGVVVACVFAIGIIGASAAILIMSAKARSLRRRQDLQKLALASGYYGTNGKGAATMDVEARQPNQSEDNLPLISQGGQYNQGYGEPAYYNAPSGQNAPPFVPPKLHQGLGALGQDYNGR